MIYFYLKRPILGNLYQFSWVFLRIPATQKHVICVSQYIEIIIRHSLLIFCQLFKNCIRIEYINIREYECKFKWNIKKCCLRVDVVTSNKIERGAHQKKQPTHTNLARTHKKMMNKKKRWKKNIIIIWNMTRKNKND